MLPLPDNTPHSTMGITGVPVIPWDNMNMAMHDTLSGDLGQRQKVQMSSQGALVFNTRSAMEQGNRPVVFSAC